MNASIRFLELDGDDVGLHLSGGPKAYPGNLHEIISNDVKPINLKSNVPFVSSISNPKTPSSNPSVKHHSSLPAKSSILFSKTSYKHKKKSSSGYTEASSLLSEISAYRQEKTSVQVQPSSKPEKPGVPLEPSSPLPSEKPSPDNSNAPMEPSFPLPSEKHHVFMTTSSTPSEEFSSKPATQSAPMVPSTPFSSEKPSSTPEKPGTLMEASSYLPTEEPSSTAVMPIALTEPGYSYSFEMSRTFTDKPTPPVETSSLLSEESSTKPENSSVLKVPSSNVEKLSGPMVLNPSLPFEKSRGEPEKPGSSASNGVISKPSSYELSPILSKNLVSTPGKSSSALAARTNFIFSKTKPEKPDSRVPMNPNSPPSQKPTSELKTPTNALGPRSSLYLKKIVLATVKPISILPVKTSILFSDTKYKLFNSSSLIKPGYSRSSKTSLPNFQP